MTNTYVPTSTDRATQWLLELNDAIQSGDDGLLWQLIDSHEDKSEAHHRVAQQVSRLVYRVGGEHRFSELFAVPVLEQPGTKLLNESRVWKQADICINEALQSWLPARTRKTVFAGVQPYDWIGSWQPGVLRCHLQSSVPGRNIKVSFVTENIECPQAAPRLGFIFMVVTNSAGWLRTPEANTMRDNRFKSVVSYALQPPEPGAEPPIVLAPDRLQYAVTDGLGLWLHQMHEAVDITGWMAAPSAASPDVVKITLAFDDEAVPFTQFTVRKHQIGLEGLEEILQLLHQLAPTLDHPMDIPPARRERQTVELT